MMADLEVCQIGGRAGMDCPKCGKVMIAKDSPVIYGMTSHQCVCGNWEHTCGQKSVGWDWIMNVPTKTVRRAKVFEIGSESVAKEMTDWFLEPLKKMESYYERPK